MMGGSYAGTVQWQTLKEMPPHLTTIIPSAAPFMGIDVPQPNNIYKTDYTMWLSMVAGKTPNVNIYGDSEFWHSHYYRLYAEGLPYEKLAEITGFNQEFYARWMAHPSFDEYWKAMNPAPEDYQRFNIPILSITGYFDGSKAGTLHHYFQHMQYGSEEAKQVHYLIVGPWNHAGTKRPTKIVGGLEFGDKYAVYPNMRRMYLEWFNWIIKGKERPGFLKKRVSCFVMNANKWLYEDRVEDQSSAVDRWYLASEDGRAQDVLDSGSLVSEPPDRDQKPDIFEYDPLKIMSRKDFMKSVRDPAPYLSHRMAVEEDCLVYHSPPLMDELLVAGYSGVKLHIELNVSDTDIQVGLFEIRPDGTSIYLAQGWIRARYRNSISNSELVTPGDINLYDFKILDFFVRKLEKGSRLRLVVGPVNTPLAQKNYNSGGIVSKESADDARKAVIKLHHDKTHPSRLELPVKK
jgi:putative CocE/NonD family hydrolase